jgi:hypothetical protein
MISNRSFWPAAGLIFVLAGCSAGALDWPWPSHRDSYLLQGEKRSLELFTGLPDFTRAALQRIQPEITSGQLEALRLACGGAPDPSIAAPAALPFAVPAVTAAILTAGIQFAGAEAKRAVEEWASSFEAQWSGRRVTHFYAVTPASRPADRVSDVRLTGECFVLERQVDGNRTAFLFIGRFIPSEDGFALKIRPLFLRHSATKARAGSGGRFVSAMTLTIEGVWADARGGVSATRNVVLTTSMDFGENVLGAPRDGVIPAERWEPMSSNWFPFVPVSREADGRLTGRGPVTITATVTETAKARDLAGAAARSAGRLIDRGTEILQQRVGSPN